MARTKELIKAATISRVSDKATGKFLGFGVKSNHSERHYQIRCAKDLKGVTYTCDCEARQWGHAECCHIKAVKQLVEARRNSRLPAPLDDELTAEQYDNLADLIDETPEEHAAYRAKLTERERERKLAAQAAYRDLYPDDYGYYGDVA
jgi:hypothetical protein